MNMKDDIPGFLSVKDTAARLGVGEHQVYALIKLGELDSLKVSERATLVDAASVVHYQIVDAKPGRPYKADKAMGMLWLLSGLDPEWLDYHQKRRCKNAVAELSAESLKSKCRKRARTVRFRVDSSYVEDALKLLVPSGVSAARCYGFDLSGIKGMAEGYGGEGALTVLKEECFAIEDLNGNVILHVAEFLPDSVLDAMPEAVVALDLAESLESRLNAAGMQRLEGLLDG